MCCECILSKCQGAFYGQVPLRLLRVLHQTGVQPQEAQGQQAQGRDKSRADSSRGNGGRELRPHHFIVC